METLIVGIADLKVCQSPDMLCSLGLGSCVAIALYDINKKLGGLVHIMLPTSVGYDDSNKAKFADSGIPELLNRLLSMGASRGMLQAKIAGGADMFSNSSRPNSLMIGARNADMSKSILENMKIKLVSEDIGGNFGRTVEFNTETGMMKIKTIGHGEKLV